MSDGEAARVETQEKKEDLQQKKRRGKGSKGP